MDIQTVLNVATVISAAQGCTRVARLEPTTGDVVYGTARRVTGVNDDVLGMSLEVTTDQGWEVAWNVGVLAQQVERGEFIVQPD